MVHIAVPAKVGTINAAQFADYHRQNRASSDGHIVDLWAFHVLRPLFIREGSSLA